MMVKEAEPESDSTNKGGPYCYVNESQSMKSEEAKTSHRQFADSTVEIGMLGKSELDLTDDTGKSDYEQPKSLSRQELRTSSHCFSLQESIR